MFVIIFYPVHPISGLAVQEQPVVGSFSSWEAAARFADRIESRGKWHDAEILRLTSSTVFAETEGW